MTRTQKIIAGLAWLVLGGAVTYASTRQFKEPTVEERPVMERRLVCPSGYDLYKLEIKELFDHSQMRIDSYPFSEDTWLPKGPREGSISMYKDGAEWTQGLRPDPAKFVCATKDEAQRLFKWKLNGGTITKEPVDQ